MNTRPWLDRIQYQRAKPEVCPCSVTTSDWSDTICFQLHLPELSPQATDILSFAKSRNFEPDNLQIRFLTSTHKQIILLMGRQTGKSTVTACKAAHLAITKPGANILLAGKVGRQSTELLDKIKRFLKPEKFKARKESIELANGSKIVNVPGTKPDNDRGFSAIDLLIIDEAAFASDELFNALSPMCAVTNGATILLSTPNGRSGFFYRAWKSPDDWEQYFQRTTDCPRVSPDYIARERKKLTEATFQQEFECEFIDPAGAMFSAAMLENLTDPTVEALIL